MMACIEASNARSVILHERLGFELVGTARESASSSAAGST